MAPKHATIWTKRATADLERILRYIANDKPIAAAQLAAAIKSRVTLLQTTPFLGRQLAGDLRELVVHRHYIVIYRIKKDQVQILSVRHAARGGDHLITS